ncbi:MAG: PAS domain S-box protein [Candidatus Hermodarchaeota archaeon]
MSEKKKVYTENYDQLIIENASDMIRILDHNFNIEYVNEAAHKNLLGYFKEELIGKFALQFIHPEDRRGVINFVRKNIKMGEGNLEFRIKKKDENYLWVNAIGKIIEDFNGEAKILMILRDITKQKNLEQKLTQSQNSLKKLNFELEKIIKRRTHDLQQSEKKYRDLFQTSPNPILLVDLKGNIIDCNKSTLENYGYSREEIVNKNFTSLDVFHNLDLSDLVEKLKAVFQGKVVDPIELQLKKKNGETTWVIVNGSLIQSEKKSLYQAIIQDITKIKEAELELKNLSNLKSEMLKTTTHELKSPLTIIKGFTNMLLDLKSTGFDEESILMLQNIKSGSAKIQKIINDILESSKLESSEVKLDFYYEDLSSLIYSSIEELNYLTITKNQEIITKIGEDLKTTFDKERISEVLVNLLNNAIKYTPPNGIISIKTETKNNFYQISIRDTGIGFTKDEKSKIFKQFSKIKRTGQTEDNEIEGSGLGLYIAKRIVELHEGKIWVESEGRNKGSTFFFTLPIKK